MTTTTKTIEVDLNECNYHEFGTCRICTDVDELTCSRGSHCAGLTINDRPAPVGFYLDADDIGRQATTFRFEGNDEFLFCEDCAYELDNLFIDDVSDPVVEGNVGELHWTVDLYGGRFQALVLAYGPDHGVIYEDERGGFDTLTEAVQASRGYAEAIVELDAEEDGRMALEQLHEDVIVELRRYGRLKHPTDLAVPTTLTRAELNTVLYPGSPDDPDPVTVRSILVDAAREAVNAAVADLIIQRRLK